MDKKQAKKIIQRLQNITDLTIKKYNLIEPNDNIIVGVSGGLDSMVLLEILATKRKYYPFNFNLKAVYVQLENLPYKIKYQYLSDFCQNLNVDLEIVSKQITIKEELLKTNPCFICSWNRRKTLFEFTKDKTYNKIALGHHLDDALTTLFMNMVYHSSLSSLPYKLRMFQGRIHLIRPLLPLTKNQIEEYSLARNIAPIDKKCLYHNKTKREIIMQIINEIEKLHPNFKRNIFNSLSNIYHEYLPQ